MKTKEIEVERVLYRQGTSEVGLGADGAPTSIKLSISSDTPYRRYDWRNDEEYYEQLDHSPSGIDQSRLAAGAALLFNHNRDIQLGKIEAPVIEGNKCIVAATVSKADDVAGYRTRIAEGILKDCSVGYEITDGGTMVGTKDKLPIYRFKWAPFEASLCTIAADISVGVGREHKRDKPQVFTRSIEIPDAENQNVVEITKKSVDEPQDASFNRENATGNPENTDMRIRTGLTFHEPNTGTQGAGTSAPVAGTLTEEQANQRADERLNAELTRQTEIRATAAHFAKHGVKEEDITAFIGDRKKTPADFKIWILENRMNAVAVVPDRDGLAAGVSQKELASFSLVKAMNEMTERSGLTGLEKEICDHARKQSKRNAQGITVPTEALALRTPEGMQRRDLTVGTSTAGGNLVATDLLTGQFIDLLRNRLIVQAMGARMLDGLTGNVAIPRATGATAAYWVSETGATSESNSSFDQVLMTPHGVSAIQDYSKLLTIQSGIGIENFVRTDIAKVLALAIDSAALAGTGTSNMPLGVLGQTGIGSAAIGTNGGPINWPTVVSLETQIATSNADFGTLGYCTNPKVRGQAKITPMQANGVEGHFIVGDAPFPGTTAMGMLNGYKLGVSNQVPSNLTKGTASGTCSALIFGNWDDLLIGQWNGVDIVVDPYTQAANRVMRYVVSMWVDIMVRHPQSFAACTDIVTG